MSDRKRPGPYPVEVRERAVRMVFDHQHEYASQWKAIESISKKLSVNHETLRLWVRKAEVDAGHRPGVTSEDRSRIQVLERENRELRRANEILKAAAHFWLFVRFRGSCGGVSAGEGWAVAAAVEEAKGDQVVGGAEPVGDAGEEPELGVDALGEPVGEAVGE